MLKLTAGTSASRFVLAASVVTPRLRTGIADRMGALYRRGAVTARGAKRDSIFAAGIGGGEHAKGKEGEDGRGLSVVVLAADPQDGSSLNVENGSFRSGAHGPLAPGPTSYSSNLRTPTSDFT